MAELMRYGHKTGERERLTPPPRERRIPAESTRSKSRVRDSLRAADIGRQCKLGVEPVINDSGAAPPQRRAGCVGRSRRTVPRYHRRRPFPIARPVCVGSSWRRMGCGSSDLVRRLVPPPGQGNRAHRAAYEQSGVCPTKAERGAARDRRDGDGIVDWSSRRYRRMGRRIGRRGLGTAAIRTGATCGGQKGNGKRKKES